MGRSPCCDENGLKKGPWTPEEDDKLIDYIQKHGHGSWRALPKLAGLNRCGKSCRLRWTNYLRPDIKRGKFSQEEEQTILHLHSLLGNKWSAIATHLQGRTDNEIKNFWNTHLKKKLIQMGYDPMTHQPRTDLFSSLPNLIALANIIEHHQLEEHAARLQTEAVQLAKIQYLQCLLQSANNNSSTISISSNSQYSISNPPAAASGDLGAVNSIINSISQINREIPLSLNNSSDHENQANSQLLQYQPIMSNTPNNNLPDPQVPFHFQTHLNIKNDDEVHLQIPNNIPVVSDQWILDTSPDSSSVLPPLTETSISSTSSNVDQGGSSSYNWSDLLFDDHFLHDIS